MGSVIHKFDPKSSELLGCWSRQKSVKQTVVSGSETGAENGPSGGRRLEYTVGNSSLNLDRGIMRKVLNLVALFAVAASCHAQSQVTDLKTLVGRKAIAQRVPFYQPGTYKEISKDYAGQEVTIIAVKPSTTFANMPFLSSSAMKSLPPNREPRLTTCDSPQR